MTDEHLPETFTGTFSNRLLIDDYPLQVLPRLATAIGLNEAIVLQQIHYWIANQRNRGKVIDGKKWIFNSYANWQEDNFPFWGVATIKAIIKKLVQYGFLLTGNYNDVSYNKTTWYTIDYQNFDLAVKKAQSARQNKRHTQNDNAQNARSNRKSSPKQPKSPHRLNLNRPSSKLYTMDSINLNRQTETNTETTKTLNPASRRKIIINPEVILTGNSDTFGDTDLCAKGADNDNNQNDLLLDNDSLLDKNISLEKNNKSIGAMVINDATLAEGNRRANGDVTLYPIKKGKHGDYLPYDDDVKAIAYNVAGSHDKYLNYANKYYWFVEEKLEPVKHSKRIELEGERFTKIGRTIPVSNNPDEDIDIDDSIRHETIRKEVNDWKNLPDELREIEREKAREISREIKQKGVTYAPISI